MLIGSLIAPLFASPPQLPLLAFAMTTLEERPQRVIFPNIVSASLYGNYRSGHIQGVDVRDLSRFSDRSFSGVSSCLLFDYFVEMEKALTECFRTLEAGGVFFTHIAPYRLIEGRESPRAQAIVQKRESYFDYLPPEANMPSVLVSRAWFLEAMQRTGFETQHVIIQDAATGIDHDWFIGRKLNAAALKPPGVIRLSAESIAPQSHARLTPEIRSVGRHVVKLPSESGLQRLRLEVSTFDFGDRYRGAQFAEHVSTGERNEVVCLQDNAVLVSQDNGDTWQAFCYDRAPPIAFWNSFTPENYQHRILQTRGWSAELDSRPESEDVGRIYIMEPSGHLVASGQCGSASWHGSYSIDQMDKSIIFGEYHVNNAQFRVKPYGETSPEERKFIRFNSLFRSVDGGFSWDEVLTLSPDDARHFHTVIADRFQPGVWWTSTGDFPKECRVFRSENGGTSWVEVSHSNPQVPGPPGDPGRLQACYRHTAMVQTREHLRWGADDIFGSLMFFDPALELPSRTGSRLYIASRSAPLEPIEVGYIGHPVRSIVDVGPGYMIMTEAFYRQTTGTLNPEVLFWSKHAPNVVVPVCTISNTRDAQTGFTFSRSSKTSNFGTFFSYRGPDLAAPGWEKILKWNVDFD